MFSKRFGRLGLLAGALVIVTSVLSCSVKEERHACPCLLTVDFTAVPDGTEYCLEDSGGGVLAAGVVSGAGSGGSVAQFKVPRDGVRFRAVSGAAIAECVKIPYGEDCPPLYLYSSHVNTDAESALAVPVLRKHFCNLFLNIDNQPGNGTPLEVRIRGTVKGIGADGRPSPGDFLFCFKSDSGSCRLPRQGSRDRLLLDICAGGGPVRTFALDRYILEAGYDWTARDLADMTLRISLSVTRLDLCTDDWSRTFNLNVEI